MRWCAGIGPEGQPAELKASAELEGEPRCAVCDSYAVRAHVCVCVCVLSGVWGCCHFGNATAHIAAITTAEKCFSATCNYYRLQIAVLASEALTEREETQFVSVCLQSGVRVCVCEIVVCAAARK